MLAATRYEMCEQPYMRHCGGSIQANKAKTGFYVSFQKTHVATVSTRQEAERIVAKLSMEANLSVQILPTEPLTDDIVRYMGGFFDGDGCVGIEGNSIRISSCQSTADISTPAPVLLFLQRLVGGIINTRPEIVNQRRHQVLRVGGSEQGSKLVDYLLRGTILKHKQCLLARRFLDSSDADERQALKTELASCKILANLQAQRDMPFDRLGAPYIAGLFDAEGHVAAYKDGYRAGIAQSSSPYLLQRISAKVGLIGTHSGGKWKVCGQFAKTFLMFVQPWIVQKKTQCDALLEFHSTYHNPNKQRQRNKVYRAAYNEMAQELKRMKKL